MPTTVPYKLPPLVLDHSPNQSSRLQPVHLVVMHATEGHYAGAVSWLKNARAQVSAHVVVREDGRQATQLVPWGRKAWACMAFNSCSDNVEMAGWDNELSDELLHVSARICAFRLHKRGLPAVWSRSGTAPGFCRHRDLGIAGGNHSDPLDLIPWLRFVAMVQHEARRGEFRSSWGIGD